MRDQNDERAWREMRESATGNKGNVGGRFFFHPDGEPVHLLNTHPNGGIFICMNGPSFCRKQQAMLREVPGMVTFGANNGGHGFRPDYWACVDKPSRFMGSIWRDGRVTKFVPMGFLGRRGSSEREQADHAAARSGSDLGGAARSRSLLRMPRVYGYRRNEAFNPDRWLTEPTINWGNHKDRGGGRSVMLVALRISILLGFRRIYLVGADFRMDKDHKYWFAEDRKEGAIRNNMTSYGIMSGYFESLIDPLDEAGVHVWNCSPGSHLDTFMRCDLKRAIEWEQSVLALEPVGATQGMYAG